MLVRLLKTHSIKKLLERDTLTCLLMVPFTLLIHPMSTLHYSNTMHIHSFETVYTFSVNWMKLNRKLLALREKLSSCDLLQCWFRLWSSLRITSTLKRKMRRLKSLKRYLCWCESWYFCVYVLVTLVCILYDPQTLRILPGSKVNSH